MIVSVMNNPQQLNMFQKIAKAAKRVLISLLDRQVQFNTPQMARPVVLLTIELSKTYQHVIDQQNRKKQSGSNMTDAKGYFVPYENQILESPHNQYIIKQGLGEGSFGRVVRAEAAKYGDVAIKISRSSEYFQICIKNEIQYIQLLSQNYPDMTVKFYESFNVGDHVCFSMELCNKTLLQLIKETQGKGFGLPIIRKLAVTFGKWLVNLKAESMIHTDLKPENMVLSATSEPHEVKLVDYGSVVNMQANNRPIYIQSRFYRSPDISLQLKYDYKIDSWSIGALLLELHTSHVCFPAGSSAILMAMFVSLMGLPPKNLIFEHNGKKIRYVVQKYFVLPTEEYWKKNHVNLEYVGLQQNDYVYLTEEVLNTVGTKPETMHRNLHEIMISQAHVGEPGHTQEDYEEYYEILRNLLTWDLKKRWSGQDILQSAFAMGANLDIQ